MTPRPSELAHNDFETCKQLFAEQKNQIIYRSFVADTQTAVAAMIKLAEGQTYHCLLESVEGDSLPTTPETLMERLSDAGISFSRHEHAPLRTVEDSKALRGEMNGTHVKNLYLRDRKKRNFLPVRHADLPALRRPGLRRQRHAEHGRAGGDHAQR